LCGGFLLLAGAAAAAQDLPRDQAKEVQANCIPSVTQSNDRGLERITVVAPCRRNEPVRAIYNDSLQQETHFSNEGVARLAVALTDAPGPIVLTYQDDRRQEVVLAPGSFDGLSAVFRITMRWEAAVDLNLHVVESGGVPNGARDATVGHSPAQYGFRGRIDVTDDGRGSGPYQESYVIANRQPGDIFTVLVENVSRGRIPSGPHCGDGPLATIPLWFVIVDRGVPVTKKVTLTPAACDQIMEDRTYYFRPRL
jgi:hypothetical protein